MAWSTAEDESSLRHMREGLALNVLRETLARLGESGRAEEALGSCMIVHMER